MGASGGERSGSLGSRGGGVIWIRAPFQTVNGNVSANGLDNDREQPANHVGVGAGAGGSIYMQGDTVVGTGVVRANGGRGNCFLDNDSLFWSIILFFFDNDLFFFHNA